MSDDSGLPAAHPAFSAHFTDELYDDEGGEFAPFGTDEGWDMVMEWGEAREDLEGSTVADLLAESPFPDAAEHLADPEPGGIPTPMGGVDAAVFVVSAAFTLLRLTGRIDPDGKSLALTALERLCAYYDNPPELVRQLQDLAAF